MNVLNCLKFVFWFHIVQLFFLFLVLFPVLQVMESLKQMGPSAIDTEIRSLSPHLGGSSELLAQFLRATVVILQTRKDFEVAQAYLGLFLKVHCQTLGEEAALCRLVDQVGNIVRDGWSTLESNFESTLCLVSFFINAVL